MIDNKINQLFDGQSRLIYELISPAIGVRLLEHDLPEISLKSSDNLIKSKIGGIPDVEEDFIWPNINNLPLAFLGQINLTKAPQRLIPIYGLQVFYISL